MWKLQFLNIRHGFKIVLKPWKLNKANPSPGWQARFHFTSSLQNVSSTPSSNILACQLLVCSCPVGPPCPEFLPPRSWSSDHCACSWNKGNRERGNTATLLGPRDQSDFPRKHTPLSSKQQCCDDWKRMNDMGRARSTGKCYIYTHVCMYLYI